MKSHPHTATAALTPPQPNARSIAERIRTLRRERGWSLADVEALSHGSIKAVVLGSYERCDRAMSLNRAIEIATLFSVPLTHLLSGPEKTAPMTSRPTIMIDLRRLRSRHENSIDPNDSILPMFFTFISWITKRRCDWNGEVLSLRESDLATLALMTFTSEIEFFDWLKKNRFLVTELNHP